MSILMWINPDGTQEQGRPIPDELAALILAGPRYLPNQRKVAYRIRVRPR